jgi:Flp pilus assembly protein TadB
MSEIDPRSKEVRKTLESLNVADRIFWTAALLRNLRVPNSTMNRSISRFGLPAADHNSVSRFWRVPSGPALLAAVWLLEWGRPSAIRIAIGCVAALVGVASLALGVNRAITGKRLAREFKRIQDKDGGHQ